MSVHTSVIAVLGVALIGSSALSLVISGDEVHYVGDNGTPTVVGAADQYTRHELRNWQRPDGSVRVGIQVGHWQNHELPDELAPLRHTGVGATGDHISEQDVALTVAKHTAQQLREEGIRVDLLPATVPSGYRADAFVAVHADGSTDAATSGFKLAGPDHGYAADRSQRLRSAIRQTYADHTGLPTDAQVTWRMQDYYAFNWRRFEHAVHPHTPAVIIETGFITSPADRRIIVRRPQLAARGIADGVRDYLEATYSDL